MKKKTGDKKAPDFPSSGSVKARIEHFENQCHKKETHGRKPLKKSSKLQSFIQSVEQSNQQQEFQSIKTSEQQQVDPEESTDLVHQLKKCLYRLEDQCNSLRQQLGEEQDAHMRTKHKLQNVEKVCTELTQNRDLLEVQTKSLADQISSLKSDYVASTQLEDELGDEIDLRLKIGKELEGVLAREEKLKKERHDLNEQLRSSQQNLSAAHQTIQDLQHRFQSLRRKQLEGMVLANTPKKTTKSEFNASKLGLLPLKKDTTELSELESDDEDEKKATEEEMDRLHDYANHPDAKVKHSCCCVQ